MVEFDHASHTYQVDGEKLDSVTTILKDEGFIDERWYTPGSADRGSLIHEATAAIDREDLDLQDFEGEEIYPYLQAWKKFKQENSFLPQYIEKQVHDPNLKYAGTLDRIGMWKDGQEVLLDIKSGKSELWHGLQLAAYHLAAGLCIPDLAESIDRRVVLLESSGRYKVVDKNKRIGPYGSSAWDAIWQTICTARVYRKRYAKV
jgi:RecB family exonuclease